MHPKDPTLEAVQQGVPPPSGSHGAPCPPQLTHSPFVHSLHISGLPLQPGQSSAEVQPGMVVVVVVAIVVVVTIVVVVAEHRLH